MVQDAWFKSCILEHIADRIRKKWVKIVSHKHYTGEHYTLPLMGGPGDQDSLQMPIIGAEAKEQS